MATAAKKYVDRDPLCLHNGDRMRQDEFHRIYSSMPEGYRAELLGGMVFEPSPLGYPHGTNHIRLAFLMESYVCATPGVEAADNATVILSDEDEVQPDLILRVVNRCRGRSHATKYVEGAPELVAEIAHSSRAIDLHLKKQRYADTGVLEYIVVVLEPARVHWFDMQKDIELSPDENGIIRSSVFPGLWIDTQGLLETDRERTRAALMTGLQSREHAQFVLKLAKPARKRKKE